MLRGLIKARPVASQLLRGAVVVPARAATFDPHYVPTVEELTRYENPNDQYSMLRNKSAHIAPPSLLSQADIKSADWYAELSEYLYKPTSFRTQTVPARARLRLVDEFGVAQAPGSRKSARAFAHIKPGTGAHVINGIPYSEYFASMEERMHAFEPLLLCGISSQVDTFITVNGGGKVGQSGAARHALANALQNLDPAMRPLLKPAHMLRRDPRSVERKKTGFAKARKRFAFVKR